MARSNRSSQSNGKTFSVPQSQKLRETTIAEQYSRRNISNEWRPAGYSRYQYMSALQDGMPVLGGPEDGYLANPDRYAPVGPLEEDFPVR